MIVQSALKPATAIVALLEQPDLEIITDLMVYLQQLCEGLQNLPEVIPVDGLNLIFALTPRLADPAEAIFAEIRPNRARRDLDMISQRACLEPAKCDRVLVIINILGIKRH